MKVLLVVVVLLLVCVSFSRSYVPERKQLSGPATEFSSNALPDPIVGALKEDSAMIIITATPGPKGSDMASSDTELIVDSSEYFSFAVFTPVGTQYSLSLYDPQGVLVPDLESHAVNGTLEFGGTEVPSVTYDFETPVVGVYHLQILYSNYWTGRSQRTFNSQLSADTDAVIVVYNQSPYQLFTHLNTYSSIIDTNVGLVSQLYDGSTFNHEFFKKNPGKRPAPLAGVDVSAEMDVLFPDGQVKQVTMHDDGLHNDLAAQDGIFGATLDATESGNYIARAKFTGNFTGTGVSFERTSQHLIPVVDGTISFTGTASAAPLAEVDQIPITLGVESDLLSVHSFRAYAEVWGTGDIGQEVPVCWIASVVNEEIVNGQTVIQLELNRKWLSIANAQPPLKLKNLSLQDIDSSVIVSRFDTILITSSNEIVLVDAKGIITEEMTVGKRPEKYSLDKPLAGVTGKVIMVHGYCAGSNVWQQYSGDFTNAVYVSFLKQSDSNDQFAKKIFDFGEQQGLAGYSAIGYSQGGSAITHLKAFYWSGLDIITNKRRIQSLVTPYLGTSAAGSTASLGSALGVGCGSNTDLSRDGAPLWAAGISQAIRSELYFYYVQFGDKGFNTRYCNNAMNMFLEKPNDGTTEVNYAPLSGANNLGLTVGECHVANMKYPPAFSNSARNTEMNDNAARS